MSNCCNGEVERHQNNCPVDGSKGSPVPTITLKSLLKPLSLENLEAEQPYFFCASTSCPIVYFNKNGSLFNLENLKVPVTLKSESAETPVCYCFGWSRDRIKQTIQQTGKANTVEELILAHIKAKRCGCEVNNPQGRCCLSDIRKVVEQVCHKLAARD
ncbi:BFD domain protein (2Fe-2S)-binding domain protein [Thalassoporum mexicanum PCC 7367]|uniref:putative iron-sulfur cluster-binding metallochaperone n=1 Tax=Thalassoporum mexicanum TaxID=3457544 RepID=UPI00029FB995|nr:(2Fe-2S)-binding protein [Pseudanabaena sp. PCC 7367]AFY70466.1 BFD domain protein (2Fe-2S)-binding domain protein [Pseudanabaena sp. PCC 7367]